MSINDIFEIMSTGVFFGMLFTFTPVGIGYAIELLYKFFKQI